MRLMGCEREGAVWRGARTGQWGPGLREHAAGCGICREVVAVTQGLAALREDAPALEALPGARQIWWRAGWLRSKQAEAAIRPVQRYRRFAAVGVAASVLAAGLSYWTSAAHWIPVPQGQWTVFGLALPAATVALAAVALAGLAVLFTLRAVLADD